MTNQTIAEKRMKKAVAYLTEYMDTYADQQDYEQYTDKIFIDDVLYGLGVALDEENYSMADGYRKFKETLKKHLSDNE